MADTRAENNLRVYNAIDTTGHYAALKYLTPCERTLFSTYIPQNAAVLDLGVGGGRTTPYLSERASQYVGLDNASRMIDLCRQKFPRLDFQVGDASDLSRFADHSFDAVVFAFNGIDFVLPGESRERCLLHLSRVLKPGGVLVFSSHNARALVVRPSWNRERLRRIARRYAAGSRFVTTLLLAVLTCIRAILAVIRACALTASRAFRILPTRTFWQGYGARLDSAHGGLYTHYSTPASTIGEFRTTPLRLERILGDDFPRPSHPLVTDWYYYVFTKPHAK